MITFSAEALVLFLIILNFQNSANGDPIVPCYFIFGDSLADNGNNNGLDTKAKANYPPYGIDLQAIGPSGRFTNGRTMRYYDEEIVLSAQYLGFEDFIPSHATARGQDLLRGVNYASASAGILSETGSNLGEHVSLDAQLVYHNSTINQISVLLKDPNKVSQLLHSCLYTVGMGSNDFINNYFLPNSSTSKQHTPDQFTSAMVGQYDSQLETLHGLGARKVALFGVGLVGCTPYIIATYANNSCVREMNVATRNFNGKVRSLVDRLNAKFTDSNFTFINVQQITTSANPILGVTEIIRGCCPMTDTGVCIPSSTPCLDRNVYAFFDGFHPTQVVNRVTAARAYKSSSQKVAHPVDISTLVQP